MKRLLHDAKDIWRRFKTAWKNGHSHYLTPWRTFCHDTIDILFGWKGRPK